MLSWTVENFQNYETERMKYNAFEVCDEVASRVHGAVASGGFLKPFVSADTSELFFGAKSTCVSTLQKHQRKLQCQFQDTTTTRN